MLTKNHEENRLLVNGSRGVVKGFVHKRALEERMQHDVEKLRERERVSGVLLLYIHKNKETNILVRTNRQIDEHERVSVTTWCAT